MDKKPHIHIIYLDVRYVLLFIDVFDIALDVYVVVLYLNIL